MKHFPSAKKAIDQLREFLKEMDKGEEFLTKALAKLVLDGNGLYLGMEKGCFVLKDKSGSIKKYPFRAGN